MKAQAVLLSIGFALLTAATGCASTTDDAASSSEAAVSSSGLHEPQGEERKAILDTFRATVTPELEGQAIVFNSTNPVGRFQAHGDWALYLGVIDGPNGTAINFSKGTYRDAAEGGYLEGVQINGHLAANFHAMAHRVNGKWELATAKSGAPTYAVGAPAEFDFPHRWAALPPLANRDISVSFPKDDLREPQGAERAGLIKALHAVVDPTLNGQSCSFNSNEPAGRFRAYDGWAYYEGIVEGPNGNATPINYANSSYRTLAGKPEFIGVQKGGGFAATVRALFKQQPDGSWVIATGNATEGAGVSGWTLGQDVVSFGGLSSTFSPAIYGSGDGDGDGGDGDGDGDGGDGGDGDGGDGDGGDGDGDGDGNGNGNGNGNGG